MPTDARQRIMLAARELAEQNRSIQGVTISLDSVAERAGLTKPGLMYHFRSKDALMTALVEHAAARWAAMLADEAKRGASDLSPFDRYRAYVTVAMTADVSRADYWIFSDALYHPSLAQAWEHALAPWFDLDGVPDEVRALLTTARFCADGAWAAEATGVFRSSDLRAVRLQALALIERAENIADSVETRP